MFFVKRKHECQNSDKAGESVQIDKMEDGILLKNVDTKGIYSNERYRKDCSLTDSKRCTSNQNNCGLNDSKQCNQAADSKAPIAQSIK